MPLPVFYEFFAGGGMVRAGLGAGWRCAFANDFDARKAGSYRLNWGDGGELIVSDVASISAADLPGRADLMWGSFPCQDLSIAGNQVGLAGKRSGAFHPFWAIVDALAHQGRCPRIVAVENVRGTLAANNGADFQTICAAFARSGFRFGAMIIDAALWVPQSRPRLFIIGVAPDVPVSPERVTFTPEPPFHSPGVVAAVSALPSRVREYAIWWRLPPPPSRTLRLSDVVQPSEHISEWRSDGATDALLSLMAPLHLAKVSGGLEASEISVGAVYRRTRSTADGGRVQRAEVRFDGLAGCLRTPGGGSSRQTVLVIEDGAIRSRLLTPRETARLMGLADSYVLPSNANAAYHLTGDGVVTDVVAHLARNLFEPLLSDCVAKRPVPTNSGDLAHLET